MNGGTKVLREEIANPGNDIFHVGRRRLRVAGLDCPGWVEIASQAVSKDDPTPTRQQILDKLTHPSRTPPHRSKYENQTHL